MEIFSIIIKRKMLAFVRFCSRKNYMIAILDRIKRIVTINDSIAALQITFYCNARKNYVLTNSSLIQSNLVDLMTVLIK